MLTPTELLEGATRAEGVLMKHVAAILTIIAIVLVVAVNAHGATKQTACSGVSWQKASHSIGKTVTLSATALGAKFVHWKNGEGSMTFLDFGGKYPNAKFTAVIWNRDATNLIGKRVCLRGKVTMYHDQPEMSVG